MKRYAPLAPVALWIVCVFTPFMLEIFQQVVLDNLDAALGYFQVLLILGGLTLAAALAASAFFYYDDC